MTDDVLQTVSIQPPRAYQGARRGVVWHRALGLALLLLGGAVGGGATAHASEAERLLRVGDLSGAWDAARAEAKSQPADLEAQERRIDIALAMGLRDLLLPELQAAVQATPDNADSHYLLGRLAVDAAEAEAHYRATLQRAPRHARALAGLGAIRRATGDAQGAADNYRQALSIDPSLSEAWAGLQAALLQLGEVEGAVRAADRAMLAVPDEPDPYIAVATLDPERAVDVLARGVARVPGDPRLRAIYARALLDVGQGAAALEQTGAALALAPGYPDAGLLHMVAQELVARRLDAEGWKELQSAQRASDPAEARTSFDGLVARYPRSALAWMGRGKVRAQAGDLSGGAADLERAASVSPGEPEILANLGLVLLTAHRADEAFAPLQAASSARPADVALGVALVKAAADSGRAKQARELAVALVERHPSDLRAIFQAAQVISAQGDNVAAYLLLRRSVPHQPDPRLLVALAAAARDAGYLAEAAEILERLSKVMDIPRARELAEQLKREELQRRGAAPPP